jgi:hypothetical protein
MPLKIEGVCNREEHFLSRKIDYCSSRAGISSLRIPEFQLDTMPPKM